MSKILGIDLGTNSIGLAVRDTDKGSSFVEQLDFFGSVTNCMGKYYFTQEFYTAVYQEYACLMARSGWWKSHGHVQAAASHFYLRHIR